MLTEQEEFPAVSIELSQIDAELVDGGTVPVLVQMCGKLLNLLRGQFCSQLEDKKSRDTRSSALQKRFTEGTKTKIMNNN